MSLLTNINAFFADHLRCGGLKFGVDGPIGWLASARGAGTSSSRSTFDMTRLRLVVKGGARLPALTVAGADASGKGNLFLCRST